MFRETLMVLNRGRVPYVVAGAFALQAHTESKDIASDLDSAIEKNYKAALTAKGLDKEHIRFDAKNGVNPLRAK